MSDRSALTVRRVAGALTLIVLVVAIAGCAVPARPAPTATSAVPLLEAPVLNLVTRAPATAAAATVATAAPSATSVKKPAHVATISPTQAPALAPTNAPTRAPVPSAAASATRRAPRATSTPDDGLRTIALADLPRQARDTVRLIGAGGPFPFDRDGVTFQNREQLLPRRPRGYYREYTVITPGSGDRGARRIVAGEGGELYYTDDHYDSFRRVIP